ncbi:MAG TPA: ABC transporter permease [Candidatus Polarisedimenticolaceae bacterium]|nr:ABC transporter permease [Candidatus Polarisedimenticolaceae bacterium]
MARRLAARFALGLLTLWLTSVIVFSLVQLAPGDPSGEDEEEFGRGHVSASQRAELRALYHLDQPAHTRYLLWLGDVARGELGRSFRDRRPVLEKISERLGVTLGLNALSLALMLAVAVPLGTLAAWRPGSWSDRAAATGAYALYALPAFVAGLLLQLLFAVRLEWLPLAGLASPDARSLPAAARLADRLAHLVLPVICLAYGGIAYLSRFVRATLLEDAAAEAGRAARARGLSSFAVVWRHGFRRAAIPLLTLAGFLLPALVGGSVIVESVFNVPGLGRLFVEAVGGRDLPVLMGLVLLTACATVGGVLAADLAYAWADPRVRRA